MINIQNLGITMARLNLAMSAREPGKLIPCPYTTKEKAGHRTADIPEEEGR